MSSTARPIHHFTIDLEEYFQVSALEPYVPRARWPSMESRVERSVAELLELLDASGTKATWFTLGWLAERHPRIVRSLAEAGHEVASHGWDHVRVTHQSPAAFRESLRRSREVLEDLAGRPVTGFRAPSFSIVPGTEWALDALVETGYRYDSSLFPIRRSRGYGYPGAPRDPHWLHRPGGSLLELPLSTVRRLGVSLPAAGGAYLRLLPGALVRQALRDSERRGQPGTFYIHPWELDAGQPRLRTRVLTRLRHYGGLARTRPRLQRLLAEFAFRPAGELLREREAALRTTHAPRAAATASPPRARDVVQA